jgi:hypothetical protein
VAGAEGELEKAVATHDHGALRDLHDPGGLGDHQLGPVGPGGAEVAGLQVLGPAVGAVPGVLGIGQEGLVTPWLEPEGLEVVERLDGRVVAVPRPGPLAEQGGQGGEAEWSPSATGGWCGRTGLIGGPGRSRIRWSSGSWRLLPGAYGLRPGVGDGWGTPCRPIEPAVLEDTAWGIGR